MLPLWRDRLHIVLAPDRVSVTRLTRGVRPSVSFNKTVPCASSQQGEAIWLPALRVAKQLLQQSGAVRADAVVLLSNHFVRYQLVGSQPDLGSLDEEQAFVRFSFAEIYGDEIDRWALRWGSGLDLAAQVASAIDQALIDQLEQALAAAGVTLISLQPYLMTAFNHVRKSIDAKPYWLVLVEPGSACVGLLQDGDWKMLHASRLGGDWAAELPMLISRELQLLGSESDVSNMILCLPGHFDHKRLALGSQSLRILMMTPEMLLQGSAQPVTSVEVQQ